MHAGTALRWSLLPDGLLHPTRLLVLPSVWYSSTPRSGTPRKTQVRAGEFELERRHVVSTFGKVTAPGASAGQGAERAALPPGQRPRCSRPASLCSAQIPGDYFDRPGISFFTHRL